MRNLVCRHCRAGLLLAALAMLTLLSVHAHSQTAAPSSDAIWAVPEVGALPDDNQGRLVRRGRDLVTATYAHIGPEVSDPSKRYAGNNLACGNCHLEAGTKKFGLPIFGLYNEFPRYNARSGAEITIEERVNSCMTRSLNGRAIPSDAPEMQAFVAYIKFLSSGVPMDQRIPGLGAGKIPELDRAADPTRGHAIYVAKCQGCHNTDGSGIRRSLPGPDSFNDGAGMNRLITAANFVHSNMPQGADYLNPVLSTADAWDVAAFVVSQPRPHKHGPEKDFPDLAQKPVGTDPISTVSARNSTNTARLRPFARLWLD
jgi:thiosulfate dehydrogenase